MNLKKKKKGQIRSYAVNPKGITNQRESLFLSSPRLSQHPALSSAQVFKLYIYELFSCFKNSTHINATKKVTVKNFSYFSHLRESPQDRNTSSRIY